MPHARFAGEVRRTREGTTLCNIFGRLMSQSDPASSMDQHIRSDQELVRIAQQGSLEAFTMLYERYLSVVYKRVCCLVPESDVEDVTQEVFISLMKSLKSFQGSAKFSTWLRTLTDRRIADYHRRRSRKAAEQPTDFSDTGSQLPPVKVTGVPADDRMMLRQAMSALPEHYREVILLRFAEGLKFEEIARVRGQSLEATKSLFRRAIAALREQVGEESHV
jgi:RNA polymerase sigma-70 factor (ECF subfamily)